MWGHGGISGYATEIINLESIWPKRIINHLGMQIDYYNCRQTDTEVSWRRLHLRALICI